MVTATFRFYEELNDFIARPQRGRAFTCECARHASAKHMIEALGVPHTEVELILVNGESVGFDHPLADGDRVAVYPKFERFDVRPLLRVRAAPLRDPRFGELVKLLNRHVAAFAKDCAFDLGGRRLKLDSLWVNVLKAGGTHSGHIHPHSTVSGTVYVTVPPGAGALKLEDPRLPLMMAAPPRTADAPEELRSFVYAEPKPGSVFLWESWLRHEVVPGTGKGERISISFNYRL